MAEIHCRHFNGYKPCGLSTDCSNRCLHRNVPVERILIIQLEAMGSVLRATSILPAIKRRFPRSHITWIAKSPSDQLLQNNPHLDRILSTSNEDVVSLSALEFDIVYCLDKSLLAGGILSQIKYEKLFGFRLDSRSGAAVPANKAAHELWQIGLSNHKKFFENKKTETQLLIEALELGEFKRDPYVLELSSLEQEVAELRRSVWSKNREVVVGINTGCSAVIPYKKLTVDFHRDLVKELLKIPGIRVVLLGGPEDSKRNKEIGEWLDAIQSPTRSGLRDGISSIEACDIVISGDSLGMHMAIARNKFVIAWFGPTCHQEVDLYDKGIKILSQANCSPCWKRFCDKPVMCYDQVSMDAILHGVKKGIECVSSSYKQPLSETYSSASLF